MQQPVRADYCELALLGPCCHNGAAAITLILYIDVCYRLLFRRVLLLCCIHFAHFTLAIRTCREQYRLYFHIQVGPWTRTKRSTREDPALAAKQPSKVAEAADGGVFVDVTNVSSPGVRTRAAARKLAESEN